MKKRETALLELLAENGKMEVVALAEKLETSQVKKKDCKGGGRAGKSRGDGDD